MIPKKAKSGGRTTGLLYYLYGPGRANEHVDPHMVAAWDSGVPDPGRTEGTNIPLLATLLDAPLYSLEGKAPDQHVYHVPVSNDASDRILSDDEWAEVAREIMDASGIAPKGDPMGARWVAVRHDPQHIHIVATLARQDGRPPSLRRDMVKMQARARELEVRFGLRQLTSGDKTASRWPTTAEAEKARRKGRDDVPRVTLQAKVREAAAVAGSDAEFFGAIERAGIRLSKRTAPDGAITGYSVALPGDRTGAGRAVWFSGSRLAPDLSLPRVRERWNGTQNGTLAAGAGQLTSQATAWQAAAEHVHQAAAILGQSGSDEGAGEMEALSDFLTTFAAQAPAEVGKELRDAARKFERAGRAPTSRQMNSAACSHLRMATQLVAMSASLGVNGGEAAAAITLLVAVALAVIAALRFHQAAQHRAQEHAAAQAGAHLRAATEFAYGASTGTSRRGNRATWQRTELRPDGPALVEAYAPIVREAIPELAERVLGEAAWPALAATLKQVQNAGLEPARVLAEVASQRGFGDADSVAEVLVWRLHGYLNTKTLADSVIPPAVVDDRSMTGVGRTVHWQIQHDDFRNEADVTVTDVQESGTLPEGTSADEFARAKVAEYAAKRRVNPARYTIGVYDGPPAQIRRNQLAYLPEGSVTEAVPTVRPETNTDGGNSAGSPVTPPPVVSRGASIETVRLGDGDAPSFGDAVRQAVPDYASKVFADPASATLAAYLIKAAGEGHQPAELLTEVAAVRDLADAGSVAQVLTWRLQGRLSTGTGGPLPSITGRRAKSAKPKAPTSGERTAADRAAQEAAQRRNQPRSPRR